MSKDNSINRGDLLKALALVRPALATTNYIPALMHLRFDGRFITSYNDISAISVRMESDLKRLIPGETLIKALGSFNAESIAFAEGKEGALTISSGRSKLKLPTLELDAFPLEWPQEKGQEIELDASILKGIERCLLSVGSDPTHPECMGVTLDSVEGRAVLFSTDNYSISRFSTSSKLKLPGDAPVILPTFLCEQLGSLAKAYSEEEIVLTIRSDSLAVEFGDKAKLLSKTLVDKEPLDFPQMFKKNLKVEGELKKELAFIPDSFDSALQRALLVLAQETDKITTFTLSEDKLSMSSSASMGDADDKMTIDGDADFGAPENIFLDPALVARASKSCGLMGFMPKALVLADSDAQFVHLVAYCSK